MTNPIVDVVQQVKPLSNFRFLVLAFLGLANVLNSLVMLSLGILLPSITRDLNLSPSEQGWLGSSMFVGTIVISLPAGFLLPRWDASKVLLASMVLGTIFVFIQASASVFVIMLLGRLAFGFAMVARQPARAVLTTEWFPPREIVMVNGLVNTTYGFAAIVGFLLTPYLLIWLNDSWRSTLTVYAVTFLLISIAWAVIRREGERPQSLSYNHPSTDNKPTSSILKNREIWFVAVGMAGVLAMEFSLLTFWPTLVLEERGIALTTSGTMLFLAAISEAVGSLSLSVYVMKRVTRGMRRPILVILVIVLVGSALGMVVVDSRPVIYLLVVLHGLGFSFVPLIWTVPFEIKGASPRQISVATGLIETMGRVGGVVGPAFVGMAKQVTGDLVLAMIISSLCGLTMAVTGLMLYREEQS